MRRAAGRSNRLPHSSVRSSAKTAAVDSPKVGCSEHDVPDRRRRPRSTRSPMPPTRAAATWAAKNGTSAPMLDSSTEVLRVGAGRHATRSAPEPPGRRRVRRSAAEPGGRRNPLLERQADEVRLAGRGRPARPRQARFRASSGTSRPTSPSTRSPLHPGSSRSRSASSSRTSSLSRRWRPSSRRPTTGARG